MIKLSNGTVDFKKCRIFSDNIIVGHFFLEKGEIKVKLDDKVSILELEEISRKMKEYNGV